MAITYDARTGVTAVENPGAMGASAPYSGSVARYKVNSSEGASAPKTGSFQAVNGAPAPDIAPGATFSGQSLQQSPSTPAVVPTAAVNNVNPGSISSNNAALAPVGYNVDPTTGAFINPETGLSPALEGRLKAYTDLGASRRSAKDIANEAGLGAIEVAQQEVNKYTGQLNTIVAQSQADILSTQGQGRGIPEAIIGGQQAQISREAAIKALPIQALLANAQGNKELAQNHFDTYYKILSQDEQNKFDFSMKMVDTIYNYADKQEQQRIDAIATTRAQNFATNQNLLNFQQSLTTEALNRNDNATASALSNLVPPDQNSPTYRKDLEVYNKKVADIQRNMKPDPVAQLELAIKAAQYKSLIGGGDADTSAVSSWVSNINSGLAKFSDVPAELKNSVSKGLASSEKQVNEEKIISIQGKIDLLNNIQNKPGIFSAVGTSVLSRAPNSLSGYIGKALTGVGLPGIPADLAFELSGANADFIGDVEQLISKEFLDSLISVRAEGGVFGSLDKGEREALTAAATKIGKWRVYKGEGENREVTGYDIDQKSFLKEITRIKDLAELSLTRAGGKVEPTPERTNTYLDTVTEALEVSNSPYSTYTQ